MKNGRFILGLLFVGFMTAIALLPLQIIRSTTQPSPDIKGTQLSQNSRERDTTQEETTTETNEPTPPPDPIQLQLDQMTIEEKVGQMFIGGSYKANMLNAQLELVKNKGFGGIVLFRLNVSSPEVTNSTISRINQIKNSQKLPLLVAIDEEGSAVSRLWSQLGEQTPQSEIKDTNLAYQVGYRRGTELKKLGINVNFAPVMDYSSNSGSFMYKRTFHTSKEQIAQLTTSMIAGYKSAGVVAVPKHFPGHPDNEVDSHDNLPSSTINRDQFNSYAKQFEILIKSDPPEMLMTGHISFPKIDPKYPSTLSKTFLTNILRNEYGYKGVIISDDMNMGAIKNSFQFEESVVLAVEAGNDMLILVTQPKFQESAYTTLLNNVRNGRISEERIDQSVYRILEMKADL